MKRIYILIIICLIYNHSFSQLEYSELFDDFSYHSIEDPALSEIIDWKIVDGLNGPPANAIYDDGNIEFIDDQDLSTNRLMKLSTFIDAQQQKVTHARIETTSYSYRHGTFAARVYFDNSPADYEDGNVETFYTISPYSTCNQANLYSECDFEYLPWDSWDNNRNNCLYYTTWETCEKRIHNASKTSFEGWHTLVYTSSESGSVKYYVDGKLMATHNMYIPDSDVNISFANWLFNYNSDPAIGNRKASMLVDWVYHAKDKMLKPEEVNSRIESLRTEGILRKNLSDKQVTTGTAKITHEHFIPEQIKISPNPSIGHFELIIKCKKNELKNIEVYNILGYKVDLSFEMYYKKDSYVFKNIESKLPSGTYFIYIKYYNCTKTKILIVAN